VYAGVWISFLRHSPNWRVAENFTRQVRKQLAQYKEIVIERGKKTLARLAITEELKRAYTDLLENTVQFMNATADKQTFFLNV
jgi:hypothetical protein